MKEQKWSTSCVGRVLDDVWTTVRVIGPNSHQLRDKTWKRDSGNARGRTEWPGMCDASAAVRALTSA